MTSMRVDRLSSREDIVPRLQTLSVPPFPRHISPSFSPPPSFPSLAHPFPSPPSPLFLPSSLQRIIPECQELDVMIKQLKLAPKNYIFFMYCGFGQKHWSKRFSVNDVTKQLSTGLNRY